MARVLVKMFATVREAAGVSECAIEASNVLELLARLTERFGRRFGSVLGRTENDTDRIVILLNGRNIGQNAASAKLADGDEVAIFPPVSGG